METWALILMLAFNGKYGQSSVVIPGYTSKVDCQAALEVTLKTSVELMRGGFCIPGPQVRR